MKLKATIGKGLGYSSGFLLTCSSIAINLAVQIHYEAEAICGYFFKENL